MSLKLRSSMRIKRRYISFNSNSQEEIERVILESLGTLGWAKASPIFIKEKEKTILSIDRKELDNLRSAIELSEKGLKILSVSGTLKGLGKR